MTLIDRHFAGQHPAVPACALAVALGGMLGRNMNVSLDLQVETTARRMAESAVAQRKLHEEVLRRMVAATDTRQ